MFLECLYDYYLIIIDNTYEVWLCSVDILNMCLVKKLDYMYLRNFLKLDKEVSL